MSVIREEIRSGMLILSKDELIHLVQNIHVGKLNEEKLSDLMAWMNDWILKNFPAKEAGEYVNTLRRSYSVTKYKVLDENGLILDQDLLYNPARAIALDYVWGKNMPYAQIAPMVGDDDEAEIVDRNSVPF